MLKPAVAVLTGLGVISSTVGWLHSHQPTLANSAITVIQVQTPIVGRVTRQATASVNVPGDDNATSKPTCLSRSVYSPWGETPLRLWTPTGMADGAGTLSRPGVRMGSPFLARVVVGYSNVVQPDQRMVVLEMENGCRRRYQLQSFGADDIAYVDQLVAQHPYARDPATYTTSFVSEGYVTERDIQRGAVKTYATQHFNLLYGVNHKGASYAALTAANKDWMSFIEHTGRLLEGAWLFEDHVLGASMPFRHSNVKTRINVYICGTGLPKTDVTGPSNPDDLEDCGHHANLWITGSAAGFADQPMAFPHEFTHVLQFLSGGFPDVKPIWETEAEWAAFSQQVNGNPFLYTYFSNLENGPIWSESRYGAFPFLSYLFEGDKIRSLIWSSWTQNLRDKNGASKEEWLEAFVRLARAAGAYPRGYASFADDMGWFGARLAALDFLDQQALLDLRNGPTYAMYYAPVAPSTSSTYESSRERPLRQWGSHVIPLTPTGGAVSVALHGRTTKGAAAWRFALVSVTGDGLARYSSLGRVTGEGIATVSLSPASGERLYLSVTATPYAYEPQTWQEQGKPVAGNRFPYSVDIVGAKPLTSPAATCTSPPAGSHGYNLNYNTNGHKGVAPCAQ